MPAMSGALLIAFGIYFKISSATYCYPVRVFAVEPAGERGQGASWHSPSREKGNAAPNSSSQHSKQGKIPVFISRTAFLYSTTNDNNQLHVTISE